MTPSAEEIAVRDWIAAVLPALDVIFERQDVSAPRPDLPYVTVRVINDRDLPLRPHTRVTNTPIGAEYETERYYLREATARIDIYGDDGREYAKELRFSLDDYTIQAQLAAAEIAVVGQPLSQIDIPVARDSNAWEPRTQIDFAIRYYNKVASTTGVIETINVEKTYN